MARGPIGPTDPWVQLSKGRTIGKTANILSPPFIVGGGPNPIQVMRSGLVDLFQIQGQNDDALQLCCTLLPPLAIPARQFPGAIIPNDQGIILAATGGRSNDDIYLHPPVGGANFSWARLACRVMWGIGGVQSDVECDFSNGLVLNICAAWIRLSVFLDYGFETSNLEASIINLGAFIGPGFPKANNAQKTLNIGPINPGPNGFPSLGFNGSSPPAFTIPIVFAGAANLFPIPRYAKQFSIISLNVVAVSPTVVNTLDCNITFFSDIAALVRRGSYRITSADNLGKYLIPNGAYYFTIQNNAAPGISDMDVIFDLAI